MTERRTEPGHRFDTIRYIYVRRKDDEMASLIWRTAQKRKHKGKNKNKKREAKNGPANRP